MKSDVVSISLAQLVADEQYQPRVSGLNRTHLDLLAESDPSDWPPLLVAPSDDGMYTLIDGFHRHADAIRRGLAALPCQVEEGAGYPEAFRANLSHGLPMTARDRRAYAGWLHGEHPDWSLRQIGRACGLSHEAVRQALRCELSTNGQTSGTAKTPEDYARRLVRTLVSAEWSGDDSQDAGDDRAQLITAILVEYDDDDREAVAATLIAWGQACVSAAEPYLTDDSTDD